MDFLTTAEGEKAFAERSRRGADYAGLCLADALSFQEELANQFRRSAPIVFYDVAVDTRQLEFFVAVAEEPSFTYAASRLMAAQSSVSERVRALEREIGVELFERRSTGIVLTRLGKEALADAKVILRAAQRLMALAHAPDELRGQIRIGVRPSQAQIDLAGIVRKFRSSHPNVELLTQALDGGMVPLLESLRKGRLDMLFITLPDPVNGVEVHSVLKSRYVVVASEESPLAKRATASLSDLPDDRWVDVPAGYGTRVLLDRALQEHRGSRTSMIEVLDFREIPRLVAALLGHAVIPGTLVETTPGAVVIPLLERVEWDLSMVIRSDASPAVRELRSVIAQGFASGMISASLSEPTATVKQGKPRQ